LNLKAVSQGFRFRGIWESYFSRHLQGGEGAELASPSLSSSITTGPHSPGILSYRSSVLSSSMLWSRCRYSLLDGVG
jgi:hypothetical protein